MLISLEEAFFGQMIREYKLIYYRSHRSRVKIIRQWQNIIDFYLSLWIVDANSPTDDIASRRMLLQLPNESLLKITPPDGAVAYAFPFSCITPWISS